jgi:hypothetical protein
VQSALPELFDVGTAIDPGMTPTFIVPFWMNGPPLSDAAWGHIAAMSRRSTDAE